MRPFSELYVRVWADVRCEVAVDRDTLYALLSDIDAWPQWTPGLIAIRRRTSGFAGPGTRFQMVIDHPKFGELKTPNQVYVNEPGCIEWGGGALGAKIRHRFELEPAGPSRTRLRNYEYATNGLALLPFGDFALAHNTRWCEVICERFARG
jgi:hypothetical protein